VDLREEGAHAGEADGDVQLSGGQEEELRRAARGDRRRGPRAMRKAGRSSILYMINTLLLQTTDEFRAAAN
jgi:hypothetical protein